VGLLTSAQAFAEPAERSRYDITVQYAPALRTLTGQMRLRFVNQAQAPVRELYFHLYLNAFEGRDTVFIREGGEALRRRTLQRAGRCELQALALADGRDLLAGAQRELVPRDHTQLRVPLPVPVAPGAAIDLHLRFVSELPDLVVRSGVLGDYALWGQFFPKLAKLQADGTLRSFPYHGMGEFYADFADYTVHVSAPAAERLACNGVQVARRSASGQATATYAATRMHDVVCVSGSALRTFRFPSERHGEPDIEMIASASQWLAVHRQAVQARYALRYFAARLGAYPYEVLRIAIAPPHAAAAAGIEFPGFITTRAPRWVWPNARPYFDDDATLFHEIAHQWFPSVVATDEVASPWLDEGLSQWLGADVQRAWYAARSPLARALWTSPDVFDGMRALPKQGEVSSRWPAHRYALPQLVEAVYARPALLLEALRQRFGAGRLWRALSSYARVHRFAHPAEQDLFDAFDRSYWPGFSDSQVKPGLD
jgi:Peptidase family M1 domain